jgi:hypothetical protein
MTVPGLRRRAPARCICSKSAGKSSALCFDPQYAHGERVVWCPFAGLDYDRSPVNAGMIAFTATLLLNGGHIQKRAHGRRGMVWRRESIQQR